ncbi:uncharacterized protein LOC110977353 isoform X2 [Acanthaster planci]|uniref:Uncharacterized protein LOC110977353 isoform X2 n=1 Tax=Acanthaster planci TaxID=133434 RepID=A0A8B7Y1P0_ACAPL|nr:uncharacterized protein LOC110977353 isoform X2 [Acanthaster planci]
MNPDRQVYLNAAMAGGDHGLGYTTVPMGWNRTIWGDGSVVYVSPSGHLLHCAEDLQRYLLAEGTCKCGLECPLIIDRVFNFNPRVPARPKLPADVLAECQLNSLCKHRRKLVAMAMGLQGNEEALANVGPPGGGSVFGRSKGSKRSRSKSKPESGVDFQPQNMPASQVLALQGGHMHHIPGIANFVSPLKSLPFEHQLQHHAMDSQQRQIQMHFLQMQRPELLQQCQQVQHRLHPQQRPAPLRRGSQEVESSWRSSAEQHAPEQRAGKQLHSSPPLPCPNRPSSNNATAGPQSTPTAANPLVTAPTCSKSPRLSNELLSPSPKEKQSAHGHSALPFPFQREAHQLLVDGQTHGIHSDACAPTVIPLLSNIYHAPNRASLIAANINNSPALFANHNDEVFFMQDGAKKGPPQPVQDSVEVSTCQPVDKNKLGRKSPVASLNVSSPSPTASKPITMHSSKVDKQLTASSLTLQEIFKQSLEGSAFPASSLLSAAARAQLAKQPQFPDGPSTHHAGDLMSGMGLFTKMSSNVTGKDPKLDSGSLPSGDSVQSCENRKLVAKSGNVDTVQSSEVFVKRSSSNPQQTDESPIQCLENAVQNLQDQPGTLRPTTCISVIAVSTPDVPQVSSAERKRPSTGGVEEIVEPSVKRQRLQSTETSHERASVEAETKQSEAAMSTHQVPAINSEKALPMHHHDTTKVTGSYNVVCSTGKAASSGKHPTVENAELVRWQQQQQEWYATMLRAKQQQDAGTMPVEHFPHMGPQIRSRGLQELQYIAMGGNPTPRMPAIQQQPNMGHMHRFPNQFMNPQFYPHQANLMHHVHRMGMPSRMEYPVDLLDPRIAQNSNMCNTNILQSMLQQQQQLQHLGMLQPDNLHHPMHVINPMHHVDPSHHMSPADMSNLQQAHGQGTPKSSTPAQRKKSTKSVRSASASSSTTSTVDLHVEDQETKDAAYWVKAASKVGGVKKVKDILAMTRSLKKHNSEAGQVEAIFQAVLDSASGGVKVIIREGTRSQEGLPSENADSDRGKESNNSPKASTETMETTETMCEVSEQTSSSCNQEQQNTDELSGNIHLGKDSPSHDALNVVAQETPDKESSMAPTSNSPDMPPSQVEPGEVHFTRKLPQSTLTQTELNPEIIDSQTKDCELVAVGGDEVLSSVQSDKDHSESPVHEATALEAEGFSEAHHKADTPVNTSDMLHIEVPHDKNHVELTQREVPPLQDEKFPASEQALCTLPDQSVKLHVADSPKPASDPGTDISSSGHEVESGRVEDSEADDKRQEEPSHLDESGDDSSGEHSDEHSGVNAGNSDDGIEAEEHLILSCEEKTPMDQFSEHAEAAAVISHENSCVIPVDETVPNTNNFEDLSSDACEKRDTEDALDSITERQGSLSDQLGTTQLDAADDDSPQKDPRETYIDQVEVSATIDQRCSFEMVDTECTTSLPDGGSKVSLSSDLERGHLCDASGELTDRMAPVSDMDLLHEGKDPKAPSRSCSPNPLVDVADRSVQHQSVEDVSVQPSETITAFHHSNDSSNDNTVLGSEDVDCSAMIMESEELNSSLDRGETLVKQDTAKEQEQMETSLPQGQLHEWMDSEPAEQCKPTDSDRIKCDEEVDNQPLEPTVERHVKHSRSSEPEQMEIDTPVTDIIQHVQPLDYESAEEDLRVLTDSEILKHDEVMDNDSLEDKVASDQIKHDAPADDVTITQEGIEDTQPVDLDPFIGTELPEQKQSVDSIPACQSSVIDQHDSTQELEAVEQVQSLDTEPMKQTSNEEDQLVKQNPVSLPDELLLHDESVDTAVVNQELENQPAACHPSVDSGPVQQEKPANQGSMIDDRPVDHDSQPMDFEPVKQDSTVVDEEELDVSVTESVEVKELGTLQTVQQEHVGDTELKEQVHSVQIEIATQNQLTEEDEDAGTGSVDQRQVDGIEATKSEHSENTDMDGNLEDSSPREQCHVHDNELLTQRLTDTVESSCEGDLAIGEELDSHSAQAGSTVKPDHAFNKESDLQEQSTCSSCDATDDAHMTSTEPVEQHCADYGRADTPGCTEHIELVKKARLECKNPVRQNDLEISGLKADSPFGAADTLDQSQDPQTVKQKEAVDCESVRGDSLIECEPMEQLETVPLEEDLMDKTFACTRPDDSCDNRDTMLDEVGSQQQACQATELTSSINQNLKNDTESSDEDGKNVVKSNSNMSFAKEENTAAHSYISVETQSLEIQHAALGFERTPEEDPIPSEAPSESQTAPESDSLVTPQGDSSHAATKSVAKESTSQPSQYPSDGSELNSHPCRSVAGSTHSLTLPSSENTPSCVTFETLAHSKLVSKSSPLVVNGPPCIDVDPVEEVHFPDTVILSETAAASGQQTLSEALSSPQVSFQNAEGSTPNGILESEFLDGVPRGSELSHDQHSDNPSQEAISEGETQSRSDDERENRENKPLTDEPSVQEMCTVKRESNLKRGVSETQKGVFSAKDAGFKKERLAQEAPTRVLRGNVRTDSSTEFNTSLFPRHLEIGDLVWGPIRGYPSWPGKLVSEAEVRGRSRREEGKMWVRWFGDHSCSQVEPEKLKTLSEGLEAHHSARQSYRRGRRMNSTLEAAIQEAMNELDKKMEQAKETKSKSVPKSSRPKTRCKRLR